MARKKSWYFFCIFIAGHGIILCGEENILSCKQKYSALLWLSNGDIYQEFQQL